MKGCEGRSVGENNRKKTVKGKEVKKIRLRRRRTRSDNRTRKNKRTDGKKGSNRGETRGAVKEQEKDECNVCHCLETTSALLTPM